MLDINPDYHGNILGKYWTSGNVIGIIKFKVTFSKFKRNFAEIIRKLQRNEKKTSGRRSINVGRILRNFGTVSRRFWRNYEETPTVILGSQKRI